jgi:hypothetical protein
MVSKLSKTSLLSFNTAQLMHIEPSTVTNIPSSLLTTSLNSATTLLRLLPNTYYISHASSSHVRKNNSSTEQSHSTNSTGLHGRAIRGCSAASFRVTSRVSTKSTSVLREARIYSRVSASQRRIGGSRRGHVGSERDFATGRCARVRVDGLIVRLGAVGDAVAGGREDAVEHVQHAVGEQDIGGDDAGAVHEHFAVDDGYDDVAAAESGDGAVGQRAAVGDGAVDDVVLQD